jgi:hypothetical protein
MENVLKISDMLDNHLRPSIAKLMAIRDFSFDILSDQARVTEREKRNALVAVRGIDEIVEEIQDKFDKVYDEVGKMLDEGRKSN